MMDKIKERILLMISKALKTLKAMNTSMSRISNTFSIFEKY